MEVKTCTNPGCTNPGTNACSACKIALYCGLNCQTADWPHHREECDGHLRKVGKANLAKAQGSLFYQENWVQALRYAEIAATKLKQLKDRRLETVQDINEALEIKFDALQRLERNREALECIKETYTLWAMNHLRNPGSLKAALALIQSCIHNEEYEDAERYARHAYFMIAEMTDNFIPSDEQPKFLAEASYWLALAILRLAKAGGIPQKEKQKAGEEAIKLSRKALELYPQVYGTNSVEVASALGTLASILDYFNDVDDDEVPRLLEQVKAIYRRVEGPSSVNLATAEVKLGHSYYSSARRAAAANDMDRCLANSELSLPHYRESVRIYRAINHLDNAEKGLRQVANVEQTIRQMRITRVAAGAATASKV